MFVPFKDDDGKLALRPALIGFIKNNACRRVAMILMWPLTVTATFAINYLLATLGYLFEMVRLTIKHVRMLKNMPWDSPVWSSPRIK
ncbi:TMhelix containing protein [Vibrio phage 1.273.O._10N.286.54.C7]|nr:TMhelix containing protein [Vibrio phage 1.273.O._10N.286.54.C7]